MNDDQHDVQAAVAEVKNSAKLLLSEVLRSLAALGTKFALLLCALQKGQRSLRGPEGSHWNSGQDVEKSCEILWAVFAVVIFIKSEYFTHEIAGSIL